MTLLTRFLSILLLGGGLAAGLAAGAGAKDARQMSVVELFTSQGCSSCPPADALLERYAKRDDVLALSMNVDYWDYLGWKDTLGSAANSERQRDYARARGDRAVYTPQIVANGMAHAPGYDAAAIDKAITRTSALLGDARVKLDVESDGDTLKVKVLGSGDDAGPRSGTVWLILFSKKETVPIGRGENAGKTISYHNVVREMTPVGTWHGKPAEFELPKKDVMSRGHKGCAVMLQAGSAGPILGAARLAKW